MDPPPCILPPAASAHGGALLPPAHHRCTLQVICPAPHFTRKALSIPEILCNLEAKLNITVQTSCLDPAMSPQLFDPLCPFWPSSALKILVQC